MNNLKIAIVGFGGMGEHHGDTIINRSKSMDLVGIYDIKESRLTHAKSKGINIFNSLDEVCNSDEVEAVIIATPNEVHKEIAIKLMESGKHVICEKPVALNLAELNEMIEASIKNNVKFTVNQNRRFDTDFLTAKKIFEDRIIGDTFSIESRVNGSRGIPGDWRGKKEHGGGMVYDWGIHMFDQLLLFTDEKMASMYAEFYHVSNTDVDDGFRVIINYENGLKALVEVSTCNFYEQPRWILYANNGSAKLDLWRNTGEIVVVKSWDNKDVKPIKASAGFTKTMAPRTEDDENVVVSNDIEFVPGDAIVIYDNFVEAIRNDVDLIISHESLRRTMTFIEEIFESAQKNIVIKY